MAQYIIPPVSAASTTPTLPDFANDGNPTVIPTDQLLSPDVEHAFLVRTPEKAVPSKSEYNAAKQPANESYSRPGYYRLCIPPKSEITGFDFFEPEEVGLRESR